MTQSDDSLGDLYLPSRGVEMRDDYEGHRAPGWKQLLCAWFIVLTVAALFKISDLISASRTAPFAHATDLAQVAEEIDRWERGEPRQNTMTVPHTHRIVLASQVSQ
jgi:hypothetical protein